MIVAGLNLRARPDTALWRMVCCIASTRFWMNFSCGVRGKRCVREREGRRRWGGRGRGRGREREHTDAFSFRENMRCRAFYIASTRFWMNFSCKKKIKACQTLASRATNKPLEEV